MATRSSILACRIPWTEEAGRLQRGDMIEQLTHTHTHTIIEKKSKSESPFHGT